MDPHLKSLAELMSQQPECAVTRPAKLQATLHAFITANEDASQPAQEGSERTAMVRTALLDRILPRHLGAPLLSTQGCSHRLRTAEC